MLVSIADQRDKKISIPLEKLDDYSDQASEVRIRTNRARPA